MIFLVDGKGLTFLVGLQVNAQGRDTGYGFGQLHQLVRESRLFLATIILGRLTQHDFTRNGQVAIKPRVPQTAAITL
jgi:hypothetical protein